jgi:hypothetical protein
LIHNNAFEGDPDELQEFMLPIGYRFFLKEATADYSVRAGQGLSLSMSWQNLGSSPIYPKMGHDFTLHIYLIDRRAAQIVLDHPVDVDITQWLPAHPFSVGHVPEYKVDLIILIPRSLPVGDYALAGAIVNNITGLPLQLAVEGEYIMGKFVFFDISVD